MLRAPTWPQYQACRTSRPTATPHRYLAEVFCGFRDTGEHTNTLVLQRGRPPKVLLYSDVTAPRLCFFVSPSIYPHRALYHTTDRFLLLRSGSQQRFFRDKPHFRRYMGRFCGVMAPRTYGQETLNDRLCHLSAPRGGCVGIF